MSASAIYIQKRNVSIIPCAFCLYVETIKSLLVLPSPSSFFCSVPNNYLSSQATYDKWCTSIIVGWYYVVVYPCVCVCVCVYVCPSVNFRFNQSLRWAMIGGGGWRDLSDRLQQQQDSASKNFRSVVINFVTSTNQLAKKWGRVQRSSWSKIRQEAATNVNLTFIQEFIWRQDQIFCETCF